jgi:NAD(P)-dependent dehydrogenase (short-subunit alcohol dehydrogenase family)
VPRVLVTGAASGIGAATVARFRRDGSAVAAVDLDAEALARADADVAVVADVASEEDVSRAVDEAAAKLGGLDAVVASAGIASRGTVETTSLEDWERVFAVNVTGVFLTARAAIPHLRRAGGGSIVVVASQLGLVGVGGAAAYCASKGAVVQLTRALAIDHAPEGIRVNCVCPGPTETPLLERYVAAAGDPAAERRRYSEALLHERLVTPDEIAAAVAYLASPDAASTIGAALVVDGGYVVR